MADIDDFLIPVSNKDWFKFEIDTAISLDLPTSAWKDQTPELVVLDINSYVMASASVVVNEAIRGGFLGFGRGQWLTLQASETFETEREEASFATVPYVFTNSSNTPYDIPAGDALTVRKDGTDVTYRVEGPFTIPALDSTPDPGLPGALYARCNLPGSMGSAEAEQISDLQDGLPGVTGTNPVAAVGVDGETDAELVTRARLAPKRLSDAGPKGAYEYVAKSAKRADGSPVDVVKVLTVPVSNSGGVIALYASATGPSADVGPNINPPPGTVNYEILRQVVPIGVPYTGLSAAPLIENITFTAYFRDELGGTVAATMASAAAKLAAFVASLPIHGLKHPSPPAFVVGVVFAKDFENIIGDAEPLPGVKPLYGVTVTSGDVLFPFGSVLALGTVTWTNQPS